MSVSSGTVTLFGSVAIAVGFAFAAAYMLKHPDEVRVVREAAFKQFGIAQPHARPVAEDEQTQTRNRRSGEVSIVARAHGHFETDAEVNGRTIEVMVDTGASLVALTFEDAERAGIYLRPSDFTHSVSTANGIAKVAPIEIDKVSIGDITIRNVRGAVSEPGKLHQTLLGMSFLNRLSRVDMQADTLILQE